MVVVCVAGCSSGSGKTTVACAILRWFPGFGAIKVTPGAGHGSRARPPGRLLKDTDLFAAAGAARVAWVRGTRRALAAKLALTLSAMEGLAGVVVEGNFPVARIPGAKVVFVLEVPRREFKEGAAGPLARADLVVLNLKGPQAVHDLDAAGSFVKRFNPRAAVVCLDLKGGVADALGALQGALAKLIGSEEIGRRITAGVDSGGDKGESA